MEGKCKTHLSGTCTSTTKDTNDIQVDLGPRREPMEERMTPKVTEWDVKNLPEEFSESHWRNLVNLGGRTSVYGVVLGGRLLPGGIQAIDGVGRLLGKESAAGFLPGRTHRRM